MGFYIGAHKRNKELITSERVGTNGSQQVWCALLFAGYAVGNWPESKRARRWVSPHLGLHRPPELPTGYLYKQSPENLAELIAFNKPSPRETGTIVPDTEECTWIMLAGQERGKPSVNIGLKLKPVLCPLLKSLVELYQQCQERPDGRGGKINASKVSSLLKAYDAVCFNLTDSCWHNKLMRLRSVIAAANENSGYLSMG